jgi:GxxExxY protein
VESNLKFNEITSIIIGSAMKIHNYFGTGFSEKIYQRSLIEELSRQGLKCSTEVEKKIFYDNVWVGNKRLDLIVENVVLVELKVITELNKFCYNQVINYLKVFGLEVGLLINFGRESLEFKRLVNYRKSSKSFLNR